MNVSGGIHLGLRYLRRRKAKTALLVGALTVTLFIPVGIRIFVGQAEEQLRSRAETTPLVVGAIGSRLELVFNALYFSKPDIATIPIRELEAISEDGSALTIPVYARFASQGARIVGTSIDYFWFRGVNLESGRLMTRLGDCVVGAGLAEESGLVVGDAVVSSPEAVFDIAGVYPLKMRITGILAPTGNPDDSAIFCDVKTAWIIEGLAHGHDDARKMGGGSVLSTEGGEVKLNASVVEYNEITVDNIGAFHFHGDPGGFPVTGAIVVPHSEKARTILMGRYQKGAEGAVQLIQPEVVMRELFATVFEVQDLVVTALVAVGIAALLIAALVFLLSNRLREREFLSLRNLGADPGTIRFLVAFEAVFVIAVSVLLTVVLASVLHASAPALVRMIVQ